MSQAGLDCVLVHKHTETRRQLGEFVQHPHNLERAQQLQPFKRRGDAFPAQQELLHALREHYSQHVKYNLNHEVSFKTYECRNLDLTKCSNLVQTPVFRKGDYDSDAWTIVDFANRVLGGGFLSHGLVQEELIMMERLDAAWFLTKKYANGEFYTIGEKQAVIIEGASHWVDVKFYGKVPPDWQTQIHLYDKPLDRGAIIAIDALPVNFVRYEYKHLHWLLRKAYVGFSSVKDKKIATGHWGGGVFLNNKNVMLCVQCLAATMAGKTLTFYSFGIQTARSVKGFQAVARWSEQRTSVIDALKDLTDMCQTDPDFFTSPPHRVKQRFSEPTAFTNGEKVDSVRSLPMPVRYQKNKKTQRFCRTTSSFSDAESTSVDPNVAVIRSTSIKTAPARTKSAGLQNCRYHGAPTRTRDVAERRATSGKNDDVDAPVTKGRLTDGLRRREEAPRRARGTPGGLPDGPRRRDVTWRAQRTKGGLADGPEKREETPWRAQGTKGGPTEGPEKRKETPWRAQGTKGGLADGPEKRKETPWRAWGTRGGPTDSPEREEKVLECASRTKGSSKEEHVKNERKVRREKW